MTAQLIEQLNPVLRGWGHHYKRAHAQFVVIPSYRTSATLAPFFFYLNDVDKNGGPFCYDAEEESLGLPSASTCRAKMRGSHKKRFPGSRLRFRRAGNHPIVNQRLEGRSRMRREFHVRFCDGGGEPVPEAKPFDIPKQLVWEAYQRVKANRGAAGVDRVSLGAFEKDLKGNLYKIWNRMSSGSYFPPPVRLVEIPKDNGGTRPLGIPTVGDRIAQTIDSRRHSGRYEGIPGRIRCGLTIDVGAG